MNVTAAPLNGLPAVSVTFACSAVVKAALIAAAVGLQPRFASLATEPLAVTAGAAPSTFQWIVRLAVPVFGVCLGLQGVVEAFGGELGVLPYPVHGKPSWISHRGKGVFEGLPERFQVGRYHSLFARRETFPSCLEITAESDDGVIMAVKHKDLPIEAVQFHPESLLTLEGDYGLRLMENVIRLYGHPALQAQHVVHKS